MAKKKELNNYTEAFNELQGILNRLESDEVNIDMLTKDIKRASELVSFCQNKLRSIETELKAIEEDESI